MITLDNFISVIVTIHDRTEFYKEAIESALNQTLNKSHYEIIVVHYIDIEKKLDQVRYIKCDQVDVGGKLSIGIENAKGNIISFLEDDDKFFPDKLKFVYDTFEDKRVVYVHNGYMSNKEDFRYDNIDFGMSCISIKKEAINKNIKNIFFSPDTFMYLSALETKGKIVKSTQKLTFYRVHATNRSVNRDIKYMIDYYSSGINQFNSFLNIFRSQKAKRLIKVGITDIHIWIILHGGSSNSRPHFFWYVVHSLKFNKIRGLVAYILFEHGILIKYIKSKID